jgi:hypothetical protein
MKVKELIEILQGFDPENTCVFYENESGCWYELEEGGFRGERPGQIFSVEGFKQDCYWFTDEPSAESQGTTVFIGGSPH